MSCASSSVCQRNPSGAPLPRRQEGHRPYAIPPDFGQQIERLLRARLIAPDDPVADLRAVGQQVIKVVIHRVGSDIAILQRQ
ncbi:hypothetical protein KPZU09_14080 [Klebsiella pneumoniae]|uniref:Uncharacterized protein n=1 Tax=Klebsiella pneumoniae TaxID=573 RepID=A0A919LXQ6_KLEPN|nr:hypothetical protein KPZU09_14080 [Klebsiella pneumoniae]